MNAAICDDERDNRNKLGNAVTAFFTEKEIQVSLSYFSKGSETNLKITTVDDMLIFEALLHTKKDCWLK